METPSIADDIREWSRQVLEVPNPYMPRNMPACPYAEKAWKQNKVHVVETSELFKCLQNWVQRFNQTNLDVVIVASFNYPDIEQFESVVESLNAQITKHDLFLMGFHPEYGADDKELDFLYEHDWESSLDSDYAMVFIQSLSQVVHASDKLERLGYYEAFPYDEYQELVVKRKRKMYNGDEAPRNEEEGRHQED